MKNRYISLIYLCTIIVLFLYRNEIIGWLQADQVSIVLVLLIAVGFIVFPVLPFKIIIGLLGYIYGPLLGALISWLAATAGSVIIYLLVRYFFLKQGSALLAKYKRLDKLKQMIEASPFWSILILRLIPVVPQSLVNIYAALLSIPPVTYTAASAIGKIPAMLVYAYIGKHLLSDFPRLSMAAGIYVLFLLITYFIYRRWFKRDIV